MTSHYKAFYKSPWGIAFIAYFVLMGLVGALTPADILTAYSWTRPFTDFMASIVPQIDKVTALGIDPDINRFYFSVMWAASPVLVFLLYQGGREFRKTEQLSTKKLSPKSHLLNMTFCQSLRVVFPIFLLTVITYHVEWVTTSWVTGSKTRLALTTLGSSLGRFGFPQVFVTGVVVFGFIFSMWLLGWFSGYIPRNIQKQNALEKQYGE